MHYITEMDMVACIRRYLIGCKFFALFQGLKHKRVITGMHFANSTMENVPAVKQVGSLNQHSDLFAH